MSKLAKNTPEIKNLLKLIKDINTKIYKVDEEDAAVSE